MNTGLTFIFKKSFNSSHYTWNLYNYLHLNNIYMKYENQVN
jgi:hypothetical protein